MVTAVADILARIVEHKRGQLSELTPQRAHLEREAEKWIGKRRDFRGALLGRAPAVIAEIKKASPSKGRLTDQFDPAGIARSYERGGAAALSVLTDEQFFQGGWKDLEAARQSVKLPVLRKDFTIDEVHVVEAAARGADAILLIAAILTTAQMERFRRLAACYGMAAIVEVHNQEELERALESGAEIVGVNNRNLHTFEVRLETSLALGSLMPDSVVRVSESGIQTPAHVRMLQAAGYQAFLVGEHLMKASDPAQALQGLLA
ncbi:MAG: indole-3-glycerol phosphate synthase TrpC [Bryobacteraceae bacterium]|nr:indole-3-glycerol phosphate synthase TrpC [Bryobacteraceae bacterium]MDW8377894.1 indole-3-glycerol phosphate synthase TrpC [Bryobacterales bacterium]